MTQGNKGKVSQSLLISQSNYSSRKCSYQQITQWPEGEHMVFVILLSCETCQYGHRREKNQKKLFHFSGMYYSFDVSKPCYQRLEVKLKDKCRKF